MTTGSAESAALLTVPSCAVVGKSGGIGGEVNQVADDRRQVSGKRGAVSGAPGKVSGESRQRERPARRSRQ